MQKKSIPILVTLMIIALGGIMCIQYFWIRQSVNEKQKLIDHKVIQAVSNTDLELADFGAMAFITHVDSFNFQFVDSTNIQLMPDSVFIPQIRPTHHIPIPSGNQNVEVQVHSMHHKTTDSLLISHTEIVQHQMQADSIRIELKQIEDELVKLDEVRNVFDRIRIEMGPQNGDFRLDSNRIDKTLKSELTGFSLDTAINWTIYDMVEQKYVINTPTDTTFRYQVPLFKTDVIHPGRYVLSLNLQNNDGLLWADIRLMIVLSVVFILIILTVFWYAVKLILKHKKISQIKSDFINNMTHEFKTPLASISLAADSIVHPNISGDPKKIAEYVQIIHQEKTRLNQNVERILEVAALEKDALFLPEERVDLTAVVTESINNLQLLLQSREGNLEHQLTSSVFIQGSAFHLNQALNNILENAIKYSPEKPVIHISLTVKNNLAEIQVKDSGVGMTAQQISRVFDSFYRVETGNIHNTKGFGLGLTYARFIIEKMHGQIHIQSQPGKGTLVSLQFPLV